jgi:hypothetical protein
MPRIMRGRILGGFWLAAQRFESVISHAQYPLSPRFAAWHVISSRGGCTWPL